MNDVNNTPNGQTGTEAIASGASVPKGTETVVNQGSLTLKEINDYLGKNYPDKDTALKSLKDTFSFVGKKVEPQAPASAVQHDSKELVELSKQVKEMKNEVFYSKNSQYDTPEYRALISKMGENPADVVSLPEFKAVFDKASGYDKLQPKKTVLESNSRIGQIRDKTTEAKTAFAKGQHEKAVDLSVDAVVGTLTEK